MVTSVQIKADADEPNFSDAEDFVDDITDEQLMPELMAKEPRLEISTEKIIVIDNIPKVGTDKKDKLKKVLTNLITVYGKIINEYYPEGENGVLKGFMFVEFDNEISAQEAVSQLNNYRLDKAHSFKVNFFSDFDKYEQLPATGSDQEMSPVEYKDPGNLYWWLMQEECFDQFCILYGDVYTSVFVNTPTPTQIERREKWTETRFQWSPKGTYLATFHERGIALWAGEKFKQFMRFTHQGVQLIDFSPCEKYLVTCNPHRAGIDDQALIIWCTRSGQKKRSFNCERSLNIAWPYFRWNYDDKYFARLAVDSLLVYETETFSLLEKKSIKIPQIADFEWSPTNNYIAYSVAENKNVPARVVLLEVPSKTEIRSKNQVNVVECKMYWQSMGDYLCVRVERYKKSNVVKEDDKDTIRYSGLYNNFEFFRIREKEIPVESLEIKESCYAFAWEPNGQKFAIIYGENTNRTSVAFYKISNPTGNTPGKLDLIKEIKNRSCLQISWSPQGQCCVTLATATKQQSTTSNAEFWDVQDKDALSLNRNEIEHMTDFEWDPTGRYFVTYVSYWNFRTDNAYIIHNFQGKQLQKFNLEKLYKFSWRPRPPTLLNAEQIKDIRKNIKQYSERYNAIDRLRDSTISKELREKRRKAMEDFISFKRLSARRIQEQKQKRIEFRNGIDTDQTATNKEEVELQFQLLVETKKEEMFD